MARTSDLVVQDDWDVHPIREAWPHTPDWEFFLARMDRAATDVTMEGATGRVLEIAAADGQHACRLAARGLATVVLEPSAAMLALARERQRAEGVSVTMVRGIAEATPFADGIFDRVLCDSALDHFADPERGIREMARVTAPDGRVVLTFVNYGGLGVRGSRLLYRIGRRLGALEPETRDAKLFWDSPVPQEHTFECTFENVRAMCVPYLELESARGIAVGSGFPGWGRVLARHPRLRTLLERLDRIARAHPPVADFVVSVWRPKARATWPADELRVRPTNPVYQLQSMHEAEYWDRSDPARLFAPGGEAVRARTNRAFTGRPDRDWLDDLLSRGPFERAAMLGCDDPDHARRWLAADPDHVLDVYDLSAGVLARARRALAQHRGRVRFVRADLNFARLPENTYDVVWSSNTVHYLVNLEHLFTHVSCSLRPGGLFALWSYVGEPGMRYAPARLERVNAILATVPARYRLVDHLEVPPPSARLAQNAGVRADEILPLARARFDVVWEAAWGRLFPLGLVVRMEAIAAEDPALFEGLMQAEAAAERDPILQPCVAYALYRASSGLRSAAD